MNRGLATSGSSRPVVVVDLGGTWVRVVASGPGRRVFRAPTPGVAGLPAVLDRLWRRWRLSRRDVAALGVASRGIWTRRRAARARAATASIRSPRGGDLRRRGRLPRRARRHRGRAAARGHRLDRARSRSPRALHPRGRPRSPARRRRLGVRDRPRVAPRRRDDAASGSRRIVTAPDAVARVAALAPSVLRRARRGDRAARRVVARRATGARRSRGARRAAARTCDVRSR